jgi:hypothetical protein
MELIACSGTKRVKYLEENIGAAKVQLTKKEAQEIRDEINKTEIIGERYPPWFESYNFADTPELQTKQ